MPENQKDKRTGPVEEAQKERGYYYDDAHGYEEYDPDEEDAGERDAESERRGDGESATREERDAGRTRRGKNATRRLRDAGTRR